MLRVVLLLALTLVALVGCAINDVTPDRQQPTALHQLSDCDNLKELENWLQTVTFSHQAFQERLKTMQAKEITQFGDDLLYLISVRETLNNAPTPECVVEEKAAITQAWTQVIDSYTAVTSGALSDMTSALDAINAQMNHTTELINQLKAQLQERINQSS